MAKASHLTTLSAKGRIEGGGKEVGRGRGRKGEGGRTTLAQDILESCIMGDRHRPPQAQAQATMAQAQAQATTGTGTGHHRNRPPQAQREKLQQLLSADIFFCTLQ